MVDGDMVVMERIAALASDLEKKAKEIDNSIKAARIHLTNLERKKKEIFAELEAWKRLVDPMRYGMRQ